MRAAARTRRTLTDSLEITRSSKQHARIERSTTMLALKYLLMLIGLGLLGSAGGLVVYDVYVAEQLRRLIKRKANGETGIAAVGTATPFRAGALAAGAAIGSRGGFAGAAGAEHRGDSRRIGWSTHQPDLGRASRHAVSRRAPGYAADRQRVAVRHARAGVPNAGRGER